jgi:hypothetical protein
MREREIQFIPAIARAILARTSAYKMERYMDGSWCLRVRTTTMEGSRLWRRRKATYEP